MREEAFSTRSRILETVDSPNSFVVSTLIRPLMLMQPERISSPARTSRGRLSPVRAEVSSALSPSMTTPSIARARPGAPR